MDGLFPSGHSSPLNFLTSLKSKCYESDQVPAALSLAKPATMVTARKRGRIDLHVGSWRSCLVRISCTDCSHQLAKHRYQGDDRIGRRISGGSPRHWIAISSATVSTETIPTYIFTEQTIHILRTPWAKPAVFLWKEPSLGAIECGNEDRNLIPPTCVQGLDL